MKLAQCTGLSWPDEDKIIRINEAINEKLSSALIDVDLPDDDYDGWVSRVRKTASRLEARQGYVTESHTSTRYLEKLNTALLRPFVERSFSESSKPKPSPQLDADGDVQMSGVNLVALINALVGKVNSSTSSNLDPDKNRRNNGSLIFGKGSQGQNGFQSQKPTN